jgi:hypothetical protein
VNPLYGAKLPVSFRIREGARLQLTLEENQDREAILNWLSRVGPIPASRHADYGQLILKQGARRFNSCIEQLYQDGMIKAGYAGEGPVEVWQLTDKAAPH